MVKIKLLNQLYLKKVFVILALLLISLSCAQKPEEDESLFQENQDETSSETSLENLITSFIQPASATYGEGGEILFQINFLEEVNISSSSRLSLNIGETTKYAQYKTGSGTRGVEFLYIVESGLLDTDGIELNTDSVDLNGGELTKVSDDSNISPSFSSLTISLNSVLVDTTSGVIAPDQVTGVTTAPTTSNSDLSVAWSTPNDNGTSITNYSVQYREQGTETWINNGVNPTSNSTRITGLTSGVTYEFRVAANNGLLGKYSEVSQTSIFDISSLDPIAWLSATDISNGGTEPQHGDKISSWSDLTGVAGDATEDNTTNQPTYETNVFNGLPAVRFDNHTKGLEGTFNRINNGGLTVILVGKMDSNNTRECFFEFYSKTVTRRGFFFNYGMNEANTNFNLDDTSFNLWHAYDNGTHTDMYENNQTIYTNRPNWNSGQSTAFTGSGAYVLGDDSTSGDQLNGYIAEFLVFDRELTSPELNQLKTYLKNKWGTP